MLPFNQLCKFICKYVNDSAATKHILKQSKLEIQKKSSVFQATTEPQIVSKTSRRQVECVPKCKTLDGESVKIVGDFDMAAILADFKIFRWFFF
jgi:hypothetical protein